MADCSTGRREDTARHPGPRIFKGIVSSGTTRNLDPRFCSSSSSHNQMLLKVPGRIRVYLVPPYSAMRCFLRLSTPYLRWGQHSPAGPAADRCPDKLKSHNTTQGFVPWSIGCRVTLKLPTTVDNAITHTFNAAWKLGN